jgi:uncharacterized XkdX family phage protein
MSNYAERVKGYYERGYYTEAMVRKLGEKGRLNEEEVEEILKGDVAQ